MTQDEFEADLEQFLYNTYNIVRSDLPRDTGNLADNAYKLVKTPTGYKIYLDMNVAPYAGYPNDPGHVTANYWDNAAEKIISSIITRYKM